MARQPGITDDKAYIGERKDPAAGLIYLNARYYDPDLAFFTQPDWFEVVEPCVGLNRFAYSFNDPVNLSDPGGNAVGDWFDSREVSDARNSELAEEMGNAADRLANDESFDGRLARSLGGVKTRQKLAEEFQSRVGLTRAQRIVKDLSDFASSLPWGRTVAVGKLSTSAMTLAARNTTNV